MTLALSLGYRTLAWFSTENICIPELQFVQKTIKDLVLNRFIQTKIEDIFYGVSFGRFDFLLDFSCLSGKVASKFICDLASKLEENSILVSFSSLLCRTIIYNGLADDPRKSPIRAYMYVRPTCSIEEVICKIEKEVSKKPELATYLSLMWNDSAYPLILAFSGEVASITLDVIRSIRECLSTCLNESSTFIALEFGNKDKKGGRLFAISFVKLREFPGEIMTGKELEGLWSKGGGKAVECLGWYDVCIDHSAHSLLEMQTQIFALREKNKKQIYQTSTTLLRPRHIGRNNDHAR